MRLILALILLLFWGCAPTQTLIIERSEKLKNPCFKVVKEVVLEQNSQFKEVLYRDTCHHR